MITPMNALHKLKWSATCGCHCTQNFESLHSHCFGKMCRLAFFAPNAQLGLKHDGLGFLAIIVLAIASQLMISHLFIVPSLVNEVFHNEQQLRKTLTNGFAQTNHSRHQVYYQSPVFIIKHTSMVKRNISKLSCQHLKCKKLHGDMDIKSKS